MKILEIIGSILLIALIMFINGFILFTIIHKISNIISKAFCVFSVCLYYMSIFISGIIAGIYVYMCSFSLVYACLIGGCIIIPLFILEQQTLPYELAELSIQNKIETIKRQPELKNRTIIYYIRTMINIMISIFFAGGFIYICLVDTPEIKAAPLLLQIALSCGIIAIIFMIFSKAQDRMPIKTWRL